MAGGYAGKMGFVDLKTDEIKIETLDEELARDFIGRN
jgi:aldehyde:ferredoxin oxidoreductase